MCIRDVTLTEFMLDLKNLLWEYQKKLIDIETSFGFTSQQINILIMTKILESMEELRDHRRLTEKVLKVFNPDLSFVEILEKLSQIEEGVLFQTNHRAEQDRRNTARVFYTENNSTNNSEVRKERTTYNPSMRNRTMEWGNKKNTSKFTGKRTSPSPNIRPNKGVVKKLSSKEIKSMDYCLKCESLGHHSRNCGWNTTYCLYTSDAADERSSVDLGGRRIIKKKKKKNE